MNNPIVAATRAFTLCAAAVLSFPTANASTNDTSVRSTSDGRLSYVVRFDDIDVSKMAGVQTLYSRLRSAAKTVCEPLDGAGLHAAAQHRACMDKALSDAVASVDRPMLSQYHQSRTGDKSGLVQLAKAN
jgi:UrcA family protein